MSRIARDQIVKLIVGAGQASPSPPVGPALGSKGVKSMDFCKASQLSPSPSPDCIMWNLGRPYSPLRMRAIGTGIGIGIGIG